MPASAQERRASIGPGKNLGTGNRCGHKPDQFAADRLNLPKVKGGFLPRVMTKILARAVDVFNDPDLMFKFTHHKDKRNKDGRLRLVRSEGREAVGLVTHAIVSCLDLASLRVGFHRADGSFYNYSCLEIAERCNMVRIGKDPENPGQLKRMPSSRFWRALTWLQDFGALTLFEQYKDKGNDVLRARAAIKAVSAKFLRRLGSITGGVFAKARSRSYQATAKFLYNARSFGIQTVQEAEQLDTDIAYDKMMREVFDPKYKNTAPKGHKPVVVSKAYREPQFDRDEHYDAYTGAYAELLVKIEQDLKRPLTGLERMTLPAKARPDLANFAAYLKSKGLQDT